MEAYRDQYASVFRDGKGVVLLAISADPAEALSSWAGDDDFQFLFGSDPDGSAYAAFGGDPHDNGIVSSRAVFVVGPDGRVADVIPKFNQVDPAAYKELQSTVDRLAKDPE
jgi:peroxiredoxin Q/BCP